MKQDKQPNAVVADCTIPGCIQCEQCSAFNWGDKRVQEVISEVKSLYGAEALSYYFYFMPVINRA